MSVVTVLLVLFLLGVLARSRVLRARLAALCLDASAGVLAQVGPMSPRAIVREAVRQARAKAADSPSGLVAPNRIEVAVAERDYDASGPVADSLGEAILAAMRAEAEQDEEFIVLPDTTARVVRAPGVRSHRPGFRMSFVRQEPTPQQHPGLAPVQRNPSAAATTPFPRPVRASLTRVDHVTALAPSSEPRTVVTRPHFEAEVLVDNEPVLTVALGLGRHRVGRASDCPLQLSHPTVSAHHALLTVDPEYTTIQDTDSTNGTRVHGRLAEEPERLGDEDTILLSAAVSLRVLRTGAQRHAA